MQKDESFLIISDDDAKCIENSSIVNSNVIIKSAMIEKPIIQQELILATTGCDQLADFDASAAELASFKIALDDHAIVGVTDTKGIIIYVNDKFCDISGYSREELVGQNHRILNSGNHSQSFFADMYRTIANGQTWHGTLKNRAKDDSFYWVETTITPSRDKNGRITRYIAIRTDVTALFKKDKALLDQNERFNRALENMAHGLVMFDAEQRLIVCNRLFAIMYGLTDEQLEPGTTLRQIMAYQVANGLSDQDEIETGIRDWLGRQGNEVLTVQTHNLSDGRTIQVTFAPMAEGGWLATHEDITERRKAEQELLSHRDRLQELVDDATESLKTKAKELRLALDKEKELNTLQREFVSMASHEFRTPLAIIDANAQRIERRAKKDRLTNEDLLPRIGKIRTAIERMTRLMESTLSAARMQDGRINVQIRPCDIGGLVQEVADRQQEIAKNHHFHVRLKNLPDHIQADRGALDQVLTNLLSNAVKYAPDVPDIDIAAVRSGAYVIISIRDHGIGIDTDDLSRIGERFFRAKTSTGIEGTGIGLNLVGKLIELHDGALQVDSKKGEGSVFAISVPIAGPADLTKDVSDAA